ncbi:DUF4173 domain-containing protein [Paractinoplanes ferrugineus]|uniref:DUF4173 domain-containing protein n=1 Tax=Paractinoplanes ferrugineus TaxID=113564 RepID=A0A919J1U4_9ACTN|nr:DUF4173 domain-containing protein [Actinoplanes ferrugineus]GIE11907.1 hypothetical protein Afe05nite_37470 [Actinoplanes ferrugineus]
MPPALKNPIGPPTEHGPWPSDLLWGKQWPGPARSAPAATVVAIAIAAVVAAISLPLDRAGVGWLVMAVAGTVALVISAILPEPPASGPSPLVVRPRPKRSVDAYGWAGLTVALVAVGTFRSAGWLFALCLLMATLTGALALTGGRSMRSIVAGYTMPLIAVFRALPWLRHGTTRLRGRIGGGTANVRVLATVVVSIALLTVFGALFASADAAFAGALSHLAPDVDVPSAFRWIFVFALAVALFGGAAFLRTAPPDLTGLDGTEGRKVARFEWAVPLGLLVLLFAGFVAVQLAVLFGGNRHVLDTDGLTFAEYARGGFWQLCFVTGLTLVVLAGAARWAPREKPADRLLLRVLMGALAGLTLLIVASALHRMNVYADTYGLTRLRLLVACCEGWFGLVLVLVLIAGIRIRAPWLPRVAIAAGVLALLGLAGANPDRVIAEHNIKQSRTLDVAYLGTLSPDAATGLDGLDSARRRCVLAHLDIALLESPDDWRGWNLGRVRARTVIADAGDVSQTWQCP